MLLFLNEDRKVGGFNVNYLGQRKKIKGNSEYINSNYLEYLPFYNAHILKKKISIGGSLYNENDTVEVDNNNITYFELKFEDKSSSFNLYPKVQTDSNSDMIVFSPDKANLIAKPLPSGPVPPRNPIINIYSNLIKIIVPTNSEILYTQITIKVLYYNRAIEFGDNGNIYRHTTTYTF